MRTWLPAGLLLAAGALALLAAAEPAEAQGSIINNGQVMMGVRVWGDVNVQGGPPSCEVPATAVVGVRFMPTNCDSTAAGCVCEGWGVAYNAGAGPITGYTSGGIAGPGTPGGLIIPVSFVANLTSAVAVVDVGQVRVTHDYHPSPLDPNVYEVVVTLNNTGATAAGGLKYRRAFDWDVEPSAFSEYVTIFGVTPRPAPVVYFSDNGFAPADPNAPPGSIRCPVLVYFVDCGPSDIGSVFDLDFGVLAPGQEREFHTYFGAAGNETALMASIAAVRAEIWSIGQPSPGGGCAPMTCSPPNIGSPNSFFWGFGKLTPPAPPVAIMSISNDFVCIGDMIYFEDLSTSPAPWVLTGTQWDFGDGTLDGFDPSPNHAWHSYSAAGTYPVTLTAENDAPMSNTTLVRIVQVIDCTPPPPPNNPPVINVPPDIDVGIGETVMFRVTGFDPDGDATAFSIQVMPPGLPSNFNPNSGWYVWESDRPGEYRGLRFRIQETSTVERLYDEDDIDIVVRPRNVAPAQADADGDGAMDSADACPNSPGRDGTGCPVPPTAPAGSVDEEAGNEGAGGPDVGPTLGGEEVDSDRDGIPDTFDNCPFDVNPSQADLDRDTTGDACDDDLDGDGVRQADGQGFLLDNCPWHANPDQVDSNQDGIGDACLASPALLAQPCINVGAQCLTRRIPTAPVQDVPTSEPRAAPRMSGLVATGIAVGTLAVVAGGIVLAGFLRRRKR